MKKMVCGVKIDKAERNRCVEGRLEERIAAVMSGSDFAYADGEGGWPETATRVQ